jgi:hypothetical protein
MTTPRSHSRKHIDEVAKQAISHAMDRVVEFADVGDDDAFVKQIKKDVPRNQRGRTFREDCSFS